MRQLVGSLFLALALASCSTQGCELCGRWRSNAPRTLAEMEKSTLLSGKQRQFFRNNFYGLLVVEIRQNDSRAYFPDQSPESVPWEPSHVVFRFNNSFVVQDTVAGKEQFRFITLDGGCYRINQPNLGFGEWFCRDP